MTPPACGSRRCLCSARDIKSIVQQFGASSCYCCVLAITSAPAITTSVNAILISTGAAVRASRCWMLSHAQIGHSRSSRTAFPTRWATGLCTQAGIWERQPVAGSIPVVLWPETTTRFARCSCAPSLCGPNLSETGGVLVINFGLWYNKAEVACPCQTSSGEAHCMNHAPPEGTQATSQPFRTPGIGVLRDIWANHSSRCSQPPQPPGAWLPGVADNCARLDRDLACKDRAALTRRMGYTSPPLDNSGLTQCDYAADLARIAAFIEANRASLPPHVFAVDSLPQHPRREVPARIHGITRLSVADNGLWRRHRLPRVGSPRTLRQIHQLGGRHSPSRPPPRTSIWLTTASTRRHSRQHSRCCSRQLPPTFLCDLVTKGRDERAESVRAQDRMAECAALYTG